MSIQEEVARLIELFGGIEALDEAHARARAHTKAFVQQEIALTKKYPDKWVGFYDEGNVLGVADSLDEAVRLLREEGVPPGRGIVRFLAENPEPEIL